MLAFILALGAFFVTVGGHFFLPLGRLAAAGGAEILMECTWRVHPEAALGLVLLLVVPFTLRWRGAYAAVGILGILVIAQGATQRSASFFLGENNPILVLAETTALRAHAGMGTWLIAWGAVTVLLAGLGGFYRPRSASRPSLGMLARRNLRRRVFRSATLVTGVAISAGTVFAYTLLMQTVEKTLEIGAGRLGADIMVVPEGKGTEAGRVLVSGEPSLFYMSDGILGKVGEVEGVHDASAQVYLRPFSYKVCCSLEQMLIVGYDPETDFTVGPWIQYALGMSGKQEGFAVGRLVKYYPGQTIKIFAQDVPVRASLDPTGLGYFDNAGFMPMDEVRRLARDVRAERLTDLDREARADMSFTHYFEGPAEGESVPLPAEDEISAVFVKVEESGDPAVVADRIRERVDGIDVLTIKGATYSARTSMTVVLRSLGGPVIVMWLMAAGLVAGAFSLIVNERRKEIGILRAMGARRGSVARVILLEAVELSAMGGILGLAIGGSLALLFKGGILADLGLLYIWPRPLVVSALAVLAVVLSLATGAVAGLYPAMKSARLEPYESIRGGER